MDYAACCHYLSLKPAAECDWPFGPDVRVFKIEGKMFASLKLNQKGAQMNLKCFPEQAEVLRDIFQGVTPGYHMNKRHWNTLALDGSIPDGEIARQIDHSYALVIKGLAKVKQQRLITRFGEPQLFK